MILLWRSNLITAHFEKLGSIIIFVLEAHLTIELNLDNDEGPAWDSFLESGALNLRIVRK